MIPSALKILFMRTARRVIWPVPALYAPFGILRNRGNVFRAGHELEISGFPRSGNTFATKAFLMANPGARLRSHKHIPSFALQTAKRRAPGMVLIRNPIDAAISWSIFMNAPLRETLTYYTDYYHVLLPYREHLFFVGFDDVIADFGKVILAFNARWGTNFVPFEHTPENVARCLAEIENDYTGRDGKVAETKVPRPSAERSSLKETFLRQIHRTAVWQKELFRANELYQILAPQRFPRKNPAHKTTTTQSIRLRPAM